MRDEYDVLIAWATVHGGSWHKLIRLHEVLAEHGMTSLVAVNSSAPMGLQPGLDFTEEQRARLADRDVHILPEQELRELVRDTRAGLYVFDAHENPFTAEMVAATRRDRPGARTAQMPSLLIDYACHGADYILVQHPMTFYFELDFIRSGWSRRLARAGAVRYSGNIFYEPVLNTWTTDVHDWAGLCAKYGLDPDKPLGLWLPDRSDGASESYGRVLEALADAGLNAMVKMHPWEYKLPGQGGVGCEFGGKTSAEVWGVAAIEEKDTSLAYDRARVAVMRGSSVGLEMPLWRTPSIFVPHDRWQFWPEMFHDMLPTCSYLAPSLDALPALARKAVGTEFSEEEFLGCLHQYTLAGDSIERHAEIFREILDAPRPAGPIGDLRWFRREYLGKIPFPFLKKRHYLEHGLHRLLRAARGGR